MSKPSAWAKVSAILLAAAAGGLFASGCNMWKGFGRDVQQTGQKIEGKDQVTASGTRGERMTVTLPRSVTLRRGESGTVEIVIERQNFTGPVRVTVSQLPRGVQADVPAKPVETGRATVLLKADWTADLVSKQPVNIAVDGPSGMRAVQSVKLTIKQ